MNAGKSGPTRGFKTGFSPVFGGPGRRGGSPQQAWFR